MRCGRHQQRLWGLLDHLNNGIDPLGCFHLEALNMEVKTLVYLRLNDHRQGAFRTDSHRIAEVVELAADGERG